MRFFCLVNPVSGGRKGEVLARILEREKQLGKFAGTVEELEYKNLGEQLKRACDYDRILVAGGDGTFSQVICALNSDSPPVGLLPLGTGNDLAKEIGVHKLFSMDNVLSLIDFYKTAKIRPITVWTLEYGDSFKQSLRFTNYVSFGMDARIVNRFASWRKSSYFTPLRLLGVIGNRIGYAGAGTLESFWKLDISKIRTKRDGEEYQHPKGSCRSLIFANIRSIMGLGISNNSSDFSDSKIELVMTRSIWNYLSMLLRLKGPCPRPNFCGASESWIIENLPENTPLQIDGEGISNLSSSCYRISRANSIKLLVN